MDPIINPMAIYAIVTLDKISHISGIFLFIGGLLLIFYSLTINEEKRKFYKKKSCFETDEAYAEQKDLLEKEISKDSGTLKIITKLWFLALALFILIPKRDEMVLMYASSFITPDNLTWTKEAFLELIKEIAETVKSI